jgi:hypothetical protein
MYAFELLLAMMALLVITAQTLRHVYVRWIEKRGTILARFQEKTERDIAYSKRLEELVALYEEAWKKVKEHEKSNPEQIQSPYGCEWNQKEPYKSECRLRQAIDTWEQHSRQIRELHFFWWFGFVCVVLGAICCFQIHEWMGLSLLLIGFLEMLWATCPSFRRFGSEVEFDRLLTWKVVYSAITLLLEVVPWLYIIRRDSGA